MSRVFAVVFVIATAAAVQQTAVGANGSAVPSAPSGGGGSSSMPVITPEQIAANAYNSGIAHKNKGLKFEADAAKATKDREKILGKAKDEYGKALKDFKKAMEIKPDAYQAYNGMGFALRKTGEPVKALEMYDKALTLSPGFPDALEYRGEAYLALNRIDDAKAAYLELFAKDREQAGQLMKAMADWVATRQTDPAGVDPGAVAAFDTWIKERAKVAALTSNMSLSSNHSAWR
jgi:tetratricopeptide (TPR) repeat protein